MVNVALGIDYGEARIGVAVSDALGMLAHPVETIHRAKVEDPAGRIAQIAGERGAGVVVIGMPYRMDGTKGGAAERVEAFIAALRKALPPGIAIAEVDERLTTVEAQRKLNAAGRGARESRSVIDQAAAVEILQDYLNSQNGPSALLLPDPWDEEE
ncbi:MAG: Holliday junction resolvase RuvX [Verrucomicrobiales bacterium]